MGLFDGKDKQYYEEERRAQEEEEKRAAEEALKGREKIAQFTNEIENGNTLLDYYTKALEDINKQIKKTKDKNKKQQLLEEQRVLVTQKILQEAKNRELIEKRTLEAEKQGLLTEEDKNKTLKERNQIVEKICEVEKDKYDLAQVTKEQLEEEKKWREHDAEERKKEREERRKEKKKNQIAAFINAGSSIISGVGEIWQAEQKKQFNLWKAEQDVRMKTIETGGKIFQRHMQTFAKGMVGSINSSFAGITQGVQQGAYAAAGNSIDVGTELLKNTLADRLDRLMYSNYAVLTKQSARVENQALSNQQINTGFNMIQGVASAVGPIVGAVTGLFGAGLKTYLDIKQTKSQLELQKLQTQYQLNEKQMEQVQNVMSQGVDAAQTAVSAVLQFADTIESVSKKTEEAAKNMANTLGMSGSNVAAYTKFFYQSAANLKVQGNTYFNKNGEDMAKVQSAYIESSGRNITMGHEGFRNVFALGTLLGDDNLASSLLGDMDYFNQTVENSTDMIYKMWQTSNKAGINAQKAVKNIQQNLKLAQKYTFKGGVENLMKMSIWAQQTRFNMQNLETSIDKIRTGGLEGVIKESAQLQVLGGNFAMYSDPMGMLYDSWADPESMGKRLHAMTKDMGKFNRETGQTEIATTDAMLLQAYADATGVSYTDARAQVEQRVKNNVIDSYLGKGSSLTDEQKALLYSKAQYDTQTGQWNVRLNNGEQKNISDLNEADFQQLMPVEMNIYQRVNDIYSLLQREGGATNHAQSKVAAETQDNVREESEKRIKENISFVDENLGTIKDLTTEAMTFATEQNERNHEIMMSTQGVLQTQFNLIEKATTQLATDLQTDGSKIHLALEYAIAEIDGRVHDAEQIADQVAKAIGAEAANLSTPYQREVSREEMDNQRLKDKLVRRYNRANELANEMPDAGYFERFGKGQRLVGEMAKEYSSIADAYKKQGDLWNWGTYKVKAGVQQTGGRVSEFLFNLFGASDHSKVTSQVSNEEDVISQGLGSSMYVRANKVVGVHDGTAQLAKTDPNDTAIFAKTGGPFDTLFNGVFRTIAQVSDKMDLVMRPILALPSYQNGSSFGGAQQTIQHKHEFSGSIELKSNGQSIDLLNLIQNDPNLVRQLTEAVVQQLGTNQNGGKAQLFSNRWTV